MERGGTQIRRIFTDTKKKIVEIIGLKIETDGWPESSCNRRLSAKTAFICVLFCFTRLKCYTNLNSTCWFFTTE